MPPATNQQPRTKTISTKHERQKLRSISRQPFAHALHAWRKRRALSVAQCAQAAGITYHGWKAYENGMAFPRVETMQRIAQAFDIDWHKIITFKSPATSHKSQVINHRQTP